MSSLSVSDTYRTFSKEGRGFLKEKGSKFIAVGIEVHNEEDIKAALEKIRIEFHDARHHCYAWRLGPEGKAFRANDDGEPSNSAGKPILGQLIKYDLSNCLIVVVRYFGGVKLGVGGLISAYKGAAEDCINEGEIIERQITEDLRILFSYELMNDVMQLVNKLDLNVVARKFENSCELIVRTRLSEKIRICEAVDKVYGAEW